MAATSPPVSLARQCTSSQNENEVRNANKAERAAAQLKRRAFEAQSRDQWNLKRII
jgi:hypothetical protein